MSKQITITAFLLSTIMMAFFNFKCTNKKRVDDSTSTQSADTTSINTNTSLGGKNFVDTLESLNYFAYADQKHIDTLKKEIADTYDKYKIITTVSNEKPPFESFCRRYYTCDGETLFEIGGLTDYLKDIKPTFDRLKIPLVWSDEYFSPDVTLHTINLNGKKYTAFKGDPNDLRIWGFATKYFVEMLNDQLQLHNSNERVYPIMFNNDGRIIFLTQKQYEFIYQHTDKKETPLEVNLWWNTYK